MRKILVLVLCLIVLTSCDNKKSLELEYSSTIKNLETNLAESQLLNQKLEQSKVKYENLNEEQRLTINQLENTVIKLEEEIEITKNNSVAVPYLNNWKYPPESGLMKYIGDVGIRSLPSYLAPIIMDASRLDEGNEVLLCRAVISTGQKNDGPKWGVVLKNEYGITISGYVPYKELESLEREEYNSVESLGEYSLGDRIEKMIGILDREYKIISDNVCMYTFPDVDFGPGEPINQLMNGTPTIDAFVSDDFRVNFLRTDSTLYELSSGYKVGDNAKEVIMYYSSRYKESSLHEMQSWSEYEYKLSDIEYIAFGIDTTELNEESKIVQIILH